MGVTCDESGSTLKGRAARRRPRKGGHNTQNRNDTYPGWQGKSNGGGGVSPTAARRLLLFALQLSPDAEKTLERTKVLFPGGLVSFDAALVVVPGLPESAGAVGVEGSAAPSPGAE